MYKVKGGESQKNGIFYKIFQKISAPMGVFLLERRTPKLNIEYLQIGTEKAIKNLSDWWILKLGLSGILIELQFHFTVFLLFCLLVILDLSTKWIALAKQVIEKENPSVWEEIKAIPLAHREGIISSDVMKTRFVCKIMVYIIIVIGSGVADIVLEYVGKPDFFITLAIGYLAASELLSIVENLDEAGVDGLKDLIELIGKAKRR